MILNDVILRYFAEFGRGGGGKLRKTGWS